MSVSKDRIKKIKSDIKLYAKKRALEDAAALMFDHAGTDAALDFCDVDGNPTEAVKVFNTECMRLSKQLQARADKIIIA